jgi:hypothetical protein
MQVVGGEILCNNIIFFVLKNALNFFSSHSVTNVINRISYFYIRTRLSISKEKYACMSTRILRICGGIRAGPTSWSQLITQSKYTRLFLFVWWLLRMNCTAYHYLRTAMICWKVLQAEVAYIASYMLHRTRKVIRYGWNIFLATYKKTFWVWNFDDDIYLLLLGFGPMAVVSKLLQKQERDSYLKKRNNTQNNANKQNNTRNRKKRTKQKTK